MGILDWFKIRPSHLDPGTPSDEVVVKAVDKAITLTNPRLKLLEDYQQRLSPSVQKTLDYLRERMLALPPAIRVSATDWSSEPVLRAFFASPSDIPAALGLSKNLRTFFAKFPDLDEAYIILGMTYSEQHAEGVSLQGDVLQRDSSQKIVDFSVPRTRICGHDDAEVRHLLKNQSFEYLIAQALQEIGETRSERQELEEHRALIHARLRILQQQGPGLGTVFNVEPTSLIEQAKLEAALLENERLMDELGSSQAILEGELACLCKVLDAPERYIRFERKQLRLSPLNVLLEQGSNDVGTDVLFTMAVLEGVPKVLRAFVLGRLARAELPNPKIDFAQAERLL